MSSNGQEIKKEVKKSDQDAWKPDKSQTKTVKFKLKKKKRKCARPK